MAETFLPEMTGVVLRVRELDALVPFAHVTLLAPFGGDGGPTAGEIADLEDFFAEVAPFEFRLSGESRFPDGPRYWCPEPAATFRRLTHDLHHAFPEYPPFQGAFATVVPHLTVPDDAPAFGREVRVTAREATLLHHDESGFREVRSFALGTSAA
ncbi:MAG TPA: 2'-5' RNA ligase family protein [Marmoricola sp.]